MMFIAVITALHTTGCAKHSRVPRTASIGHREAGIASWYGDPYHGRKAANGEVYDMNQLTAAHRTLPFGTWVEVANLSNAKRVTVRITDRGPFVSGRIIDLSRAAAEQIDMVRAGTARVHLKVVRASPSGATFYAVQVASFTDPKEAEGLKARFVAQRQSAQVMPAALRWRVLVGHESSLEDATLLVVSLRADYPGALVVKLER